MYATLDGERYHRKERAITSFEHVPDVTAAIDVPDVELGETSPEDVERYATEAQRMATRHDPGDVI